MSRVHRPEESEVLEDDGLFENYRLTADEGQQSIRIDKFLSNLLKNKSRSQIKSAAEAGLVRVNGKVVKASYSVKPGDVISFFLPHPPPPKLEGEDIPLDIVYEDADLVIINKPAGLVMHPGVGNFTGTLVNGLIFHLQNLPKSTGDEKNIRPGLVHRIDKNTSGIVVVAKNDYALAFLAAQFKAKTTKRTYYAIVWGVLKEDKGTITGFIGRSKKDRKIFTIYDEEKYGKHSVTHYEVVERYDVATLVKCQLETGRTHQIRVHFRHIGHPLFGDPTYGGLEIVVKKSSTYYQKFIKECLEIMPRQALHAYSLGFVHPSSEKEIFFEEQFPADFVRLIAMMESAWKPK